MPRGIPSKRNEINLILDSYQIWQYQRMLQKKVVRQSISRKRTVWIMPS